VRGSPGWAVGAAIAVAIAASAPGRAHATELHTLFDARCRHVTGVLVHVSSEAVAMVGLDGRFVTRTRGAIDAIAVHRTLENPLARIGLSPQLQAHLRDVWVGDDAAPTFTGWTTSFFDDLFLYFDLEGQTHVLDPEEIQRIRPAATGARFASPRTHAPVQLGFPAEVVPCGTRQVAAGAVLPTRVIADRIKVGDYLGKLEQHYLALAGFEERTRVYAEPFLFDERSRAGLLYDPEWLLPFPLYVRWSNGRPYRFQSLAVIGNSAHEWLPFVHPSISARSDVKSHFFSASFVGHILGLPAGTDPFEASDPPEPDPGDPPDIDHSYNYMLLLGADWWRLSAAVGASYLVTRISLQETQLRTVRADGLSPTVRLRYLGSHLQLRALFFRTRSSAPAIELFVDEEDPFPGDEGGGMDLPFHWRLDTIRVGGTWQPHPTVEISADQIGTRGAFRDQLVEAPLVLRLWEFTTSGELAVTFGRYVTVRGHARLYVKNYDLAQPVQSEETLLEGRFGGALEFVF
jgi:hypothetical protein